MNELTILFAENLFILVTCIYIIRNVNTCNYVKIAISTITLYIINMSFHKPIEQYKKYNKKLKYTNDTDLSKLTDSEIHNIILNR